MEDDEFASLSKPQLSSQLRELGLKVTGTRDALINRLKRHKSEKNTDVRNEAEENPTVDHKESENTAVSNESDDDSNPNNAGGIYCCIPECHVNRAQAKKDPNLSLHRIPAGSDRKQVRKMWLRQIRTVRSNLVVSEGTRICSKHFEPKWLDGNKLNPEAVPTIFPSKQSTNIVKKRKAPKKRKFPQETTNQMIKPKRVQMTESDTQTDREVTDCSRCNPPKMVDFECQVNLPDVNQEDLRGNDQRTRFFTGFLNYGTFVLVCNLLVKHSGGRLNYWKGGDSLEEKDYHADRKKPGPARKLGLGTEFLMTMMWYRLGLLEEHLGLIFKVSPSTVSRILTTWSQFMYEHFVGFVFMPSVEDILMNMPNHFINHSNVFRIDDCTEIFIEKPSGLEAQNLTWSEYKHNNTGKVLIGVSPDGMTTYISNLWGGRASDRHIVERENALQDIPAGMAVMADKGFDVGDLLPPGVHLIVPPKVSSKSQMTPYDVFKTVDIAEPRIVVEMKMEQAKNYRILQNTIPISRIATAEQVVFNCFALTNLLPQLFVTPLAGDESEESKLPIFQ